MANNQDIENRVQQEKRAPLLSQDEDKPPKKSSEEGRRMVYFSTLLAVCGSYALGCCGGYSSPTQAAITKDINLSIAEYSLFGSILTFGAMIGAITSGKIADYIGRKGGALPLDIGRLATGYGMGVYSFVVPIYIAEIAPKDLRGALTSLYQLMIVNGVSVSFIIGILLPWRTSALIGIIPCVVVVLGLFIIRESPRWLAKQGNQKEFEASLRRLRGKNCDITSEAAEVQIGVGLMVCQQFGGINGISFYTSSIFESAGFPADIGTIVCAILQVIVIVIGVILIDRSGRKPLLVISGAGLVLGCLLAGTSFYLKEHGIAPSAVPALTLISILVYIGAFSAGMGAVPWVVMSEIFPINIKGVAGSFATLVNWFGAWACSYTFNFLMSWSSYGTFILYAAVNALAIVFVIKVVPETKGRTLEQIQAAINAS